MNKYDVIVVGGGVAGISAAVAAARGRKKVLLIEKQYLAGGLATAGLISYYLPLDDGLGNQLTKGIAEELLKLSISRGAQENCSEKWLSGEKCGESDGRYTVRFDANLFALLCEDLLKKEGAEILYGATVCKAETYGGRIKSVTAATSDGFMTFYADKFIDASGDANLCFLAGEEVRAYGGKNAPAAWFYSVEDGNYVLNALGFAPAVGNPRGAGKGFGKALENVSDNVSDSVSFSPTDAFRVTEEVEKTHRTILDNFLAAGGVSSRRALATVPTIPQIRMTRRLVGRYELDVSDERVPFADSVGAFGSWREKGHAFSLPYSSLVGRKIANLAAAGRCISVTDEMWDIARAIPVCALSGEAVGIAAAIGDDFIGADVKKLQSEIVSRGGKIDF